MPKSEIPRYCISFNVNAVAVYPPHGVYLSVFRLYNDHRAYAMQQRYEFEKSEKSRSDTVMLVFSVVCNILSCDLGN